MKKRLEEICTSFKSDILVNKIKDNNGDYPLWGAKGLVKNIDYYIQDKPYISIIKWGAGVGRVDIRPAHSSIVATMQGIIPNSDVDIKWLCYLLKSMHLEQYATCAVIPNLYYKDYCKNFVFVPNLQEQKAIVSIFVEVEKIIDNRKQELQKLDELIKARFVEMFGDLVNNDKEFPSKSLEEVADIVSGITKGRKTNETELIEVPYMAVSNVKDGYIDWTTVKTILATQNEIEQYRLLPNDILMTEGGDPDKVGRGSVIENPLDNCIHQNHIFRVRLNFDYVLPVFFSYYLRNQKAKRYFLGCAKQTTGIASINKTQLKALPVLLPSIKSQKEFADFAQQVDKSKVAVQEALDKAQLLFDSLMQEYFG